MATMGRRKIAGAAVLKKPADKPFAGVGHMAINLVLSPIQIQPIATQGFELPVLGVPIMREGFITETGLLFSSTESHYLSSNLANPSR